MLSLSQFIDYVNKSTYKLDAIAVMGLFGGDRAANALETIHFYAGQRWAGFYSYPGSMTVAMRFGQIASSRIWGCIFPGPNKPPTDVFNLAGKPGPDFYDVSSQAAFRTSYMGHLIAEGCAESLGLAGQEILLVGKDGSLARRSNSAEEVTILTLLDKGWTRRQAVVPGHPASPYVSQSKFNPITPTADAHLALWSIIPSLVSIAACVFCFLGHDLLCASLILFGILASAFSSLVLGSATLGIYTPASGPSESPGSGLMFPADGSIILLKGRPTDVNVITKGEFGLKYAAWVSLHGTYHTIGISSLLLVLQVLVQFVLLPRCTFFGQILALSSFITSSAYHLYMASISAGREKLHLETLLRFSNLTDLQRMRKWHLGTRTQMAVFICLVLGEGNPYLLQSSNLDAVLTRIEPNLNETLVGRYWRKKVLKELGLFWRWQSNPTRRYMPRIQAWPENPAETDEYRRFTRQDRALLDDLVDDARCIVNQYPTWRIGEFGMWREQQLRGGAPRAENPDSPWRNPPVMPRVGVPEPHMHIEPQLPTQQNTYGLFETSVPAMNYVSREAHTFDRMA